jgi:hypothetical protein
MTYPKDSICFPITIMDGKAPIAPLYADGDLMNNPAVGYGICWFTLFLNGVAVNDANGVLIHNIYCTWNAANKQAQLSVRAGVAAPGKYSAQPFYGVKDSGGLLNWRKQAAQDVTIAPLNGTTDTPF